MLTLECNSTKEQGIRTELQGRSGANKEVFKRENTRELKDKQLSQDGKGIKADLPDEPDSITV